MAPPPPLVVVVLLLLPQVLGCGSAPSSLRWSSQHLEDVLRSMRAQVLPRPLPRRVPQLHVRRKLVDQQPHDVLVVVDGSDVKRRVAARGPAVDVKGQTGFLDTVPGRE